MSIYSRVSGTWREKVDIQTIVSGTWRGCKTVHTRVIKSFMELL